MTGSRTKRTLLKESSLKTSPKGCEHGRRHCFCPSSFSLTASLPSPTQISTRTLAIEAGLIPLRQEPRVSQVWKQTSAAFTNCRLSHYTGAALHCCYFLTSGNDLRIPVMSERCRDGCLCNAYCNAYSLTAILCIHLTVAD